MSDPNAPASRNELLDFSVQHGKLHPAIVLALAEVASDYAEYAGYDATKMKIELSRPWWHKFQRRTGTLTTTMFVDWRGVLWLEEYWAPTLFRLDVTIGVYRLALIGHESLHAWEASKKGWLQYILQYISGVFRSIFGSGSFYDHDKIPFEQRAITFEKRIVEHYSAKRVNEMFERYITP